MPRDFQAPFMLPAGATEVVCVRHGSSVALDGVLDGHSDPPLSPRGVMQAEAVAQRLGRLAATGLFVTPLRRTAQTAAPLAARLKIDPVVIAELREVHLGAWEGQFAARFRDRDPISEQILATGRWDAIPDAEDMDAFGGRVRSGMDAIADAVGPDATAVAVMHGGVIAEAFRQAAGSLPFAFLYAENASVSRLLRLASGRWAVGSFNDISHLSALGEVQA